MQNDIKETLLEIIQKGEAHTQQDMCTALLKRGFEVNQTKVSRLLPKIGAIRVKDSAGKLTYHIDQEQMPPQHNKLIAELILEFKANGYMIVVATQPGAAGMVARLLDFNKKALKIIGTLAGDDTIFIVPQDPQEIPVLLPKLRAMFMP